ncbi:hypothetical protein [Haladaptatus halobius]|uniref:hypothetical protein n=1 Tax=Haladaptatus halobius TaxID=2884875 RepID=UPI001D09BC7B|nr:hypothetical protein [Haladaptatus halobius]
MSEANERLVGACLRRWTSIAGSDATEKRNRLGRLVAVAVAVAVLIVVATASDTNKISSKEADTCRSDKPRLPRTNDRTR